VDTKEAIGVVLVLSGLIPIYVQVGIQAGFLNKRVGSQSTDEGLEAIPEIVPESAITLLDKLLDNAGWMVVVGLILIYLGLRCLGVGVFV